MLINFFSADIVAIPGNQTHSIVVTLDRMERVTQNLRHTSPEASFQQHGLPRGVKVAPWSELGPLGVHPFVHPQG
jgi:hypothetical protein